MVILYVMEILILKIFALQDQIIVQIQKIDFNLTMIVMEKVMNVMMMTTTMEFVTIIQVKAVLKAQITVNLLQIKIN